MEATIATENTADGTWAGGSNKPLGASYGKMMMWFFILSDALTFSGFLAGYGLMRFKFIDSWPIADEVFTHVPFIHGHYPMYYVALMTFILIFSSVTMVLAVDAGHQMKKAKVTLYMLLTIVGGLIFLGSQAWEWKNFINGTYGSLVLEDGKIVQFVDDAGHLIALEDFVTKSPTNQRVEHTRTNGLWFVKDAGAIPPYTVNEVVESFKNSPNVNLRTEQLNHDLKKKVVLSREEANQFLAKATGVVKGANLKINEYGHTLFGDFFFFITGFHGFHVFTGILINIIIFFNVIIGTYERRGSYEMVEKVGLYWHFVDLVWVFVFTFFYLV
ncbi:cytochrome oxidase subunit III [Aureibaculum marinum]|uniref:Cytochrome oxidase subunit III n=1 Tax=Aureibaculum marinum TaxID=2487930 RepID=A0A3N4NKF9_9FLAO|nr:cytochrome c oxidase subunit 3 [Aureibaculum marinum]RPD95995.1 cytochrome oxidase subunit III [Aureibaculum marinum]